MTRVVVPEASVSGQVGQSRVDIHSMEDTEHETVEDEREPHVVAVDVPFHYVDDVEYGRAREGLRHCARMVTEEVDLEAELTSHLIRSTTPPSQGVVVVRTVVREVIAKLIAAPRGERTATFRAPLLLPRPHSVSSNDTSGKDKKLTGWPLCLCLVSDAPVVQWNQQVAHQSFGGCQIH
jgi:hypothetical protein